MIPWYAKAGVQGMLSVLPDRMAQRTNCVFQTHVTRSLRPTNKYVKRKWKRALWHVNAWRQYTTGPGGEGFHAVELGTGWFPITSIGLVLCGAERVVTYDINALADAKTVLWIMKQVNRLVHRGKIVPPSKRGRKALRRVLKTYDGVDAPTLLARLGIEVRVGDARTSGLPEGKTDLVCSTSTLEHVSTPHLDGLFTEFRRLAGDDSVMSHIIDLSDHYARVDASITPFNFLRYSPARWRLFNNSLHYQNRLRVSDYRRVHADAGWQIVEEENSTRPLAELRQVPVHADFRDYAPDDLRVVSSRIISRPLPLQ